MACGLAGLIAVCTHLGRGLAWRALPAGHVRTKKTSISKVTTHRIKMSPVDSPLSLCGVDERVVQLSTEVFRPCAVAVAFAASVHHRE